MRASGPLFCLTTECFPACRMAGEACALMTAWRARLYSRTIRLKRRKGPPVLIDGWPFFVGIGSTRAAPGTHSHLEERLTDLYTLSEKSRTPGEVLLANRPGYTRRDCRQRTVGLVTRHTGSLRVAGMEMS